MKGSVATPERDYGKVVQANVIDRGSPGKRSHVKISQSKRRVIIAAFIISAILASSLQLLLLMSQDGSDIPRPARISITPHSPIYIYGNDDFNLVNGVTGGSGTPSDPYIISDWAIDATDTHGIYISSTTDHFIIRNVTVNASAQNNYGIKLESVSNAWVHNVTIQNCSYGIAIEGSCASIKVDESSISNCGVHGIVAQYGSASNVNITLNTIFSNGGTGIRLGSTSQFYVVSNSVYTNETFSSGRLGIQLLESSTGLVTGNTVVAIFDQAMACTSSQNVVVAGNSFTCDWNYDLQLQTCTGFLIFHNNFLGQLLGVPEHGYESGGSGNAWNASYPIGGNYWIEYTGADEYGGVDQKDGGPDGIGDTPFLFNVSRTDYYPLNLSAPVEPIPEFPTVILPIISVFALLIAVTRRTPRKEF